jgi:hypothetical protein
MVCVVSVEVPEDLLALTPTLALAVTPPTTATPTVTPMLAPEELLLNWLSIWFAALSRMTSRAAVRVKNGGNLRKLRLDRSTDGLHLLIRHFSGGRS